MLFLWAYHYKQTKLRTLQTKFFISFQQQSLIQPLLLTGTSQLQLGLYYQLAPLIYLPLIHLLAHLLLVNILLPPSTKFHQLKHLPAAALNGTSVSMPATPTLQFSQAKKRKRLRMYQIKVPAAGTPAAALALPIYNRPSLRYMPGFIFWVRKQVIATGHAAGTCRASYYGWESRY